MDWEINVIDTTHIKKSFFFFFLIFKENYQGLPWLSTGQESDC